jgi:hypothetical protein
MYEVDCDFGTQSALLLSTSHRICGPLNAAGKEVNLISSREDGLAEYQRYLSIQVNKNLFLGGEPNG